MFYRCPIRSRLYIDADLLRFSKHASCTAGGQIELYTLTMILAVRQTFFLHYKEPNAEIHFLAILARQRHFCVKGVLGDLIYTRQSYTTERFIRNTLFADYTVFLIFPSSSTNVADLPDDCPLTLKFTSFLLLSLGRRWITY